MTSHIQTRYSNEYTPFIARNEQGKVLIHVVSIPDIESGVKFCTMSEKIKNSTPNQDDIYYHLVTPENWREAAHQISTGKNLSNIRAENKNSLPHKTYLHTWMYPTQAERFLSNALNASNFLHPATYTSSESRHFALPHWLGGKGYPDQIDDIFWCDVPRDGLLSHQKRLATIARDSAPSCDITTPIGEEWKAPHYTVLGRARDTTTMHNEAKATFTVTPTLIIGVSGWNGQLHGIVAIVNGPNGPTPVRQAVQNLRILTR